MAIRYTIRFQPFIAGVVSSALLALTGLFLYTVLDKFQNMARLAGQEKFSLIADQTGEHLVSLFARTGLAIDTLSAADPSMWTEGNRKGSDQMVLLMVAALKSQNELYSVYFALPNDDFLQVIGVRANAAIANSLKAPADTHFAVRRIQRQEPGNHRVEHWRFLSGDLQALAERRDPSEYRPSERPWFQGAWRMLAPTEN